MSERRETLDYRKEEDPEGPGFLSFTLIISIIEVILTNSMFYARIHTKLSYFQSDAVVFYSPLVLAIGANAILILSSAHSRTRWLKAFGIAIMLSVVSWFFALFIALNFWGS